MARSHSSGFDVDSTHSWFGELGHVICIGHTLYGMVISDFSHPERLVNIPQSLGVSALFNTIVASCAPPWPVQRFFSFRIYRLAKSLYIPFVAGTLPLLSFLSTVVVFVIGLQTFPFTVFEVKWGWLFNTLCNFGLLAVAPTRQFASNCCGNPDTNILCDNADELCLDCSVRGDGQTLFKLVPGKARLTGPVLALILITLLSLNSRATLRRISTLSLWPHDLYPGFPAVYRSGDLIKRQADAAAMKNDTSSKYFYGNYMSQPLTSNKEFMGHPVPQTINGVKDAYSHPFLDNFSNSSGLTSFTEPPFAAKDYVLVSNSIWASTCSIFASYLFQKHGVRSAVFGKTPNSAASQFYGGVKGSEVTTFDDIMFELENAGLQKDAAAPQPVPIRTTLSRLPERHPIHQQEGWHSLIRLGEGNEKLSVHARSV
ncbi:hypothetical protein FB451DRAFT_1439363 [Mycena latifolia]|nr:hypothetical protein FB451DRAFT_1439363 [Mycena latifolia]